MFKTSSQKAQSKLRRVTPRKLGDFEHNPSPEEERENLVRHKQGIVAQLIKFEKGSFEREALKQQLIPIEERIKELNLKKRYNRTFANYLCDVIKRDVTLAQWKIWVAKAEILQKTETK